MPQRLFLLVAFLICSMGAFAQISPTFYKTYPYAQAGSSSSIAEATNGFLLAAYQPGQVELIRTDLAGQQLWRKTLPVNLEIHSLQRTTDGGYVLGGAAGTTSATLLKLDSLGNQQWLKSYPWIGSVAVLTSDGGYALLANRSVLRLGLNAPDSCRIYKTDGSGNLLWRASFPSLAALSLCQTLEGGFAVSGQNGTISAALLKANAQGQELWRKSYPLGNGGYSLDQIRQLPDSSLLLTGVNRAYLTLYKSYLLKATATGDTLWTKAEGQVASRFWSSGLAVLPNSEIVTSWGMSEVKMGTGAPGIYQILGRFSSSGQKICLAGFGDGRHMALFPSDTLPRRVGITRTGYGQNLLPHPGGGFVMIGTIDSFRKATGTHLSTHLTLMKFDNSCQYLTAVPEGAPPAAAVPVYPNPSAGIFSITAGAGAAGPAGIVVRDLTGREVYRRSYPLLPADQPLELDLSEYPKGLYLLQVQTTIGVRSARLVIQ